MNTKTNEIRNSINNQNKTIISNSLISKNNPRNIPQPKINSQSNSKSNISQKLQNPMNSKLNTSQMNSHSKILEEHFSEDYDQDSVVEENSQENSNKSEEASEEQLDFEMENLNKSLRDILENISDNEEDYNTGLEKYYQHLLAKLEKLENIEEEKVNTKQVLDLQIETLDEQINHLHSMIEQFKAENKKLKNMIKTEKSKNPQLQLQIDENNQIVEKIYTAVKYLDLTKLIKFQKHLVNRRTTNLELEEATMSLRVSGGDYLKRQASVLYFLHLLKKRYKVTKISQEISKSELEKKSVGVNIIDDNLGGGKLTVHKIRIVFGFESYLVGLESEEKKETYTFIDLKNEVCDVWNIPKEDRDVYHIVNDKFHIYSAKILVWDVLKKFLNMLGDANSNSAGNLITMELINKNNILNGRNAAGKNTAGISGGKNKKEKNESNERVRKDTDISSSNGNFNSILEDYVLFLRQKEALINFFKKDVLKEELVKKHEERVRQINLNFENKNKDLEKNEADDEEFKENQNILELEIKDENEKFNNKLVEYKNKQDPLFFSTFDIFLYRLAKFWHLAFLLFVIFLILIYYSNSGTLNTIEKFTLKDLMKDVFIFNPLYKNFFRKKEAFEEKKFEKLISTRNELIIWLDLLFNNFVMTMNISDDEMAKGIDAYNDYFNRINTPYEILGSMKFSFKNSDPVDSKANSTIFELPKEIYDKIYYFEEFKVTKEDTAYKPVVMENDDYIIYQNMIKVENESCGGCFSKKKFFYNSNPDDNMIPITGVFGDYKGGNFQYYVHPSFMNRVDFSNLVQYIKETSLAYPLCRIIKIDINVLSIYLRAIVKISLIFEFSTIGDIRSKAEVDVYDTNLKQSSLSKFIGFLYYVIFLIIGLEIFLNLFTYKIIGDKAKKISYWPIYCEIAILGMLIIDTLLGIQERNLYNEIFGNLLEFNLSIYENEYAGINRWKYYEISPLLEIYKFQSGIRGGIILLLFLRLIISFSSSPLVKYIAVLFLRTTVAIFNVTVFLFIFIFSFSLIFHVILGRYVEIYSSLSNTFLITLTSVLGRLQIGDTSFMTIIHYVIVVAFFIIIKFIIFTFIFAIVKETFENVRKEYYDYIEKPHFKYVGENVYIFLKYFLFPISFYFMIRDYLRFKKRYRNFGKLEIFVKEDNNRIIYFNKLIKFNLFSKICISNFYSG